MRHTVRIAAVLACLALTAVPVPAAADGRSAPSHMLIDPPVVRQDALASLRSRQGEFLSPTAAQAAGYTLLVDTANFACISDTGTGSMGYHFVNAGLVGDPAESANQPEAVIYRTDRHGALALAAAEYVVVAAAWDASHTGPPELFGQRFSLTAAPNRYGLPPFYSLHVWAWYHNPAGTFAPYNPRVHCP